MKDKSDYPKWISDCSSGKKVRAKAKQIVKDILPKRSESNHKINKKIEEICELYKLIGKVYLLDDEDEETLDIIVEDLRAIYICYCEAKHELDLRPSR